MTNNATYAANFMVRIGEIQAECAPIARHNGAMAYTRKRGRLIEAMRAFQGQLKFRGACDFPWYVRFPDRSESVLGALDTAEELKILRSLESPVEPRRQYSQRRAVAHA